LNIDIEAALKGRSIAKDPNAIQLNLFQATDHKALRYRQWFPIPLDLILDTNPSEPPIETPSYSLWQDAKIFSRTSI